MIRSDFPIPPSANRLYRSYRGRIIKSAEYRAYEKIAIPIAHAALMVPQFRTDTVPDRLGLGMARVKVTVIYHAKDLNLGDLDNRLKALFDVVEKGGWLDNDKQIDEEHIYRRKTIPNDPHVNLIMERIMLTLKDEFDFGKHDGEQVEDVIEDDPSYIEWLCTNEVVEFDEEVLDLIAKKGIV